ncbi:hypothetical protein NXX77_04895 [Phocaeicola dorei]|nr:hypothetical protein [Phocaeicola dorei]
MRDTETAPMSGQEMRDFTAGYTTLFDAPGAVVDIHADTELRTGKKRARCFAICDETFLPDGSLDSYVRDDSLPPASTPCCTIRCWSSWGCTCRTTTS